MRLGVRGEGKEKKGELEWGEGKGVRRRGEVGVSVVEERVGSYCTPGSASNSQNPSRNHVGGSQT